MGAFPSRIISIYYRKLPEFNPKNCQFLWFVAKFSEQFDHSWALLRKTVTSPESLTKKKCCNAGTKIVDQAFQALVSPRHCALNARSALIEKYQDTNVGSFRRREFNVSMVDSSTTPSTFSCRKCRWNAVTTCRVLRSKSPVISIS